MLALSRAISIGLIVIYLLYLLLQMIVQTADKNTTKSASSIIPGRHLPLEERQSRSAQRFRSLSLSMPAFNEHKNRSGKWMLNMGVGSLLRRVRRAMFLDSGDPHNDFYVLHDISHTASSESLPALGSIEAVSSERRKHNMHQLPFFPPSSNIARPDTPMSDVGDLQPPGHTERGSPRPLSLRRPLSR